MKTTLLLFLFSMFLKLGFAQDLEVIGNLKAKSLIPTGIENPIIVVNSDGTLNTAEGKTYLQVFEPYMSCPGDTLYIAPNKFLIVPGLCDANPPPLSVQARLDTGATPFQIYQSNTLLLVSLYGKTYEGGLVFYLNTTTGTGMVCSANDVLNQAGQDKHWFYWNYGGSMSGVTTSNSIGTGQSNSASIIGAYNAVAPGYINDFAVKNCEDLVLNGKSDWYLPSNDEMVEMYNKLYNNPDVTTGNFNQSQYGVVYWSSTIGPGGFYGHRFGDVLPFPGAMRIEVPGDYEHFPPTEINTPSLKVRAVRNF